MIELLLTIIVLLIVCPVLIASLIVGTWLMDVKEMKRNDK
jgi:hypothetical protein